MSDNHPKPIQFGLRDVMWLVLVLALIGGWAVDRSKTNTEMKRLKERESILLDRGDEVRHLRNKYNDWQPYERRERQDLYVPRARVKR